MKKIVIVEDEQYLQEMYKIKFTSEGYEVHVASDGVSGLETIKQTMPDVVLLDLVMPKMDGFEVLKNLRANEATKKLKVYVLSNLGQAGEIERGTQEGADGYFVKSNLTPTQLASEINKVLN